MGVALLVIAVLLGLLVLLLAVPLDVAFRFAGIEAFAGEMNVRWLFGLVRFRIGFPRAAGPKPPEPRPKAQAARAREKPRRRTGASAFAVLRQAAFRRRLYRFVNDVVRAVHARQLYLRLRLGLGDAAETGRLWSLVGPLSALAQNVPNAEVRIEPEFVDPVIEFETRGRFLLVPLRFIALAVAFALSPASIRAWRTLRAGRA